MCCLLRLFFGFACRIYLFILIIVLQLIPHVIVIVFMYRSLECMYIPRTSNLVYMFGYVAYFYRKECVNLTDLDFPPGFTSPAPDQYVWYQDYNTGVPRGIPSRYSYAIITRWTGPKHWTRWTLGKTRTPNPASWTSFSPIEPGKRKRRKRSQIYYPLEDFNMDDQTTASAKIFSRPVISFTSDLKNRFFQVVKKTQTTQRKSTIKSSTTQKAPIVKSMSHDKLKKLLEGVLTGRNDLIPEVVEKILQYKQEKPRKVEQEQSKAPKEKSEELFPLESTTTSSSTSSPVIENSPVVPFTLPEMTSTSSSIVFEDHSLVWKAEEYGKPQLNILESTIFHEEMRPTLREDRVLNLLLTTSGTTVGTTLEEGPVIYITNSLDITDENMETETDTVEEETRSSSTLEKEATTGKEPTSGKEATEESTSELIQTTTTTSSTKVVSPTGLAKPMLPYIFSSSNQYLGNLSINGSDVLLKEIFNNVKNLNPEFWDEDKVEWLMSLVDPINWILYFLKLTWGEIPPNSLVTMLTQKPYLKWPAWGSIRKTPMFLKANVPKEPDIRTKFPEERFVTGDWLGNVSGNWWPYWWNRFETAGWIPDRQPKPTSIMWPSRTKQIEWVRNIVVTWIILDFSWAIATILLLCAALVRARGCFASFLFAPFLLVTLAVIIMDLVSAGYFGVTIPSVMNFWEYLHFVGVLNVAQLRNPENSWFPDYRHAYSHASWLITLFFIRGVVIWIINVIYFCKIIHIFRKVLGQRVIIKDIIINPQTAYQTFTKPKFQNWPAGDMGQAGVVPFGYCPTPQIMSATSANVQGVDCQQNVPGTSAEYVENGQAGAGEGATSTEKRRPMKHFKSMFKRSKVAKSIVNSIEHRAEDEAVKYSKEAIKSALQAEANPGLPSGVHQSGFVMQGVLPQTSSSPDLGTGSYEPQGGYPYRYF